MALSLMLSEEGYTATSSIVTVRHLDKSGGGFAITKVALQSQIVAAAASMPMSLCDGIIQEKKSRLPGFAGVKSRY